MSTTSKVKTHLDESYYEILGLKKQDDPDIGTIQKAYKAKALEFHPMKNSDGQALTEFHKTAEAYEVLSSTEMKPVYDLFG